MRTAVTITVRMKSTRLPKKALKEFCGKPMIDHLIERVGRAKHPDEIILCTSTNPQDDVLEEVARRNNIKLFRGDEDDVLDRLFRAARENDINFIVSTTGDNPLTDPEHIDKTIEKFKETGADYITGLDLPWGTFSYGLKIGALEKVLELKEERDTEVWGQYFTKSNLFKLDKIDVDDFLKDSDLRLTVDTPEDFQLIESIYNELYNSNPEFTLADVVRLMNTKPELKEINGHIIQKISNPINTDSLINSNKAMHISKEVIKDCFNQLEDKKELSFTFNEDPKIFFINLLAEFKGEDEVHENDDDLYYVAEGSAELIVDGKSLNIAAGDFAHVPAGQVHKISYTKQGIKYIVIKMAK